MPVVIVADMVIDATTITTLTFATQTAPEPGSHPTQYRRQP